MIKFLQAIVVIAVFAICMFVPWYVGHWIGIDVSESPSWWSFPAVITLGGLWVAGVIFSCALIGAWFNDL